MTHPNDAGPALKPSDEARRIADWMRDLVSNEQVGGVRMTLHSAKEVSAALDALITALEAALSQAPLAVEEAVKAEREACMEEIVALQLVGRSSEWRGTLELALRALRARSDAATGGGKL